MMATTRVLRNRFEKWIKREDPNVILLFDKTIQCYEHRPTHLLWMAFWYGSLQA